MSHSGSLMLTPEEFAKKIRFNVDLSVFPTKRLDLPADVMYVGGDSHGSYLLRIWRYITLGIISVTEKDYQEYARILHNLLQLNPSLEILLFLIKDYNEITVRDYNEFVRNLSVMLPYVGELSPYLNKIKPITAHLAEYDNNVKISDLLDESGFIDAFSGLQNIIIDKIGELKNILPDDLDTYRELLTRIKLINKDAIECDIGDRDADRVGCDFHNWLLTRRLIELGLKHKGFLDSNHGRVVLYALRYIDRLKTLSSDDFFTPLQDDECLGLPVGQFIASFLNMLRFVCMGKVSHDEIMKLFKEDYLPNINIIKVVRDNVTGEIMILTHAPNIRNDKLEHVEFLELLKFFKVDCNDFTNIKLVDKAAEEINKRFRAWFDNDKNRDEIVKAFNDESHVLYRVIWNRISDEDVERMLEKIEKGELLVPEKQNDGAGHDSGIQAIDSPMRPKQFSIDDDGGKGGFNKGGVSILLIHNRVTPEKNSEKPSPSKDEMTLLKRDINRLASPKSVMRKRRTAEDFSSLPAPIRLFHSPEKKTPEKKLINPPNYKVKSFSLDDFDDEDNSPKTQ